MRTFPFLFSTLLLIFGLSACDPATTRPDVKPESTSSAGIVAYDNYGPALEARATAFKIAIRKGDWNTVTGIIPPRMLKAIADDAGVTVPEMRREMNAAIVEIMEFAEVRFEKYDFDFQGVDIKQASATLDGQEQDFLWAFVPGTGRMSMKIPGGKRISRSMDETIWAVRDGGKWYLVRTSDRSQIKWVKKLYPFMKNVRFPR